MRSIVNLSQDFAGGASAPFRKFTFSGGEVHVAFDGELITDHVRINARCNSSEDFMRIVMAVDALRGMKVRTIDLFMPYLPYARQDRRMVCGEPYSLRVFGSMLNALELNAIYVYDVHSDVAGGTIDNLYCLDNHKEVSAFASTINQYLLVCPDGGAYKKIHKLMSYLGYNTDRLGYERDLIMANKVRDVSSGKILRTDVYGDVLGRNCLVVDDICDGGATFIGLAEKLRVKGANSIHLFVSHGIFSKGTEGLLSYYTTIATTNSIREVTPGIITYPLNC